MGKKKIYMEDECEKREYTKNDYKKDSIWKEKASKRKVIFGLIALAPIVAGIVGVLGKETFGEETWILMLGVFPLSIGGLMIPGIMYRSKNKADSLIIKDFDFIMGERIGEMFILGESDLMYVYGRNIKEGFRIQLGKIRYVKYNKERKILVIGSNDIMGAVQKEKDTLDFKYFEDPSTKDKKKLYIPMYFKENEKLIGELEAQLIEIKGLKIEENFENHPRF